MLNTVLAYSIVWPLKALTPLCFAVLPFSFKLEHSWVRSIVIGYCSAEVLFYGWFRRSLGFAQIRQHPPATTRERRDAIWRGIEESALEGESPYSFLKTWFGVSTLARISRRELKEWLAWALFDRRFDEIVSPDLCREMEERIAGGEAAFAIVVPDEALEVVPSAMRLNVDPVVAEHRPLVYYAVTSLIRLGADAALRAQGFRRHAVGAVLFWILQGDDEDVQREPPVVFVHGVGVGLATYLPFLLALSSREHRRGRTVVLLELPHVAMQLNVDVIPRMENIAECAAIVFRRFNLPPALWVAHSLGTFVFAVIQRLQPALVAGVVLLDPVCFLLWEPDLLRNFCYNTPSTPMQIVQSYHICRELSISYYFHRHFWWHECVQFAKQMPSKSLVFISECDGIYNTVRVGQYLKENNVPMRLLRGQQHGGWLMDRASTTEIVNSLQLSNL